MLCTPLNRTVKTVALWPSMTGLSPAYAANVMGALALPERRIVKPAYVPSRTSTVAPGDTASAAFWSVRHGAAADPAPPSLPVGETENAFGGGGASLAVGVGVGVGV